VIRHASRTSAVEPVSDVEDHGLGPERLVQSGRDAHLDRVCRPERQHLGRLANRAVNAEIDPLAALAHGVLRPVIALA
jgi:hypothetical protein